MKLLVFGKNGQVGSELCRSLQPLGEVVALGRTEADFSRPESLAAIVNDVGPDVIVNAAAYTSVDRAEQEESLAYTINAESPGVLAKAANQIRALMVHYSTDYVFDGNKKGAYQESDTTCPINAYGRSKAAGEEAIQASGCRHVILRTSWVYSETGDNFLCTILDLLRKGDELRVINDQFGAPTSARLIADTTSHVVLRSYLDARSELFVSSVYHLATSGITTWFGFAEYIRQYAVECGLLKAGNMNISPVSASDYQTAAKRPGNSCLDTQALEARFSLVMPAWESSLEQCLQNMPQ